MLKQTSALVNRGSRPSVMVQSTHAELNINCIALRYHYTLEIQICKVTLCSTSGTIVDYCSLLFFLAWDYQELV